MAEANHSLSPANANLRSDDDHEAAALQSRADLKRKKKIKITTYVTLFIIFQIIIGTVIALVVMRVKTPRLQLGKITVHNITAVPAMPSFDVNFTTQIRIKNKNWGTYKFEAGEVTFEYDGNVLAKLTIPKGKVGILSTKTYPIVVSVNSKGLKKGSNSNLVTDLNTGVLPVTSFGKLRGKVELMLVMKKRKDIGMYCTIQFNLSTKQLQFLKCDWSTY